MTYYSQAGQDKWVHELIGDKGYFIDVGAYDGIQTSNTYALELAGWTGICIEANEDIFKTLCKNRKSKNINIAITNYLGTTGFAIDRIGNGQIKISCSPLSLVMLYHSERSIDYMSLDIEGQEFNALNSIDFKYWDIKLLTVEHNLYCDGPEKKEALYKLLSENDYVRVVEDVKCLDPNPIYFNQPFEDWYAKKDFIHQ